VCMHCAVDKSICDGEVARRGLHYARLGLIIESVPWHMQLLNNTRGSEYLPVILHGSMRPLNRMLACSS
jgi:hypothetical protein